LVITLYDYPLSGNCYKARLLLNLLNVPHSLRAMDFYPGREHKSAWFLALNPLGQLPVLQDDALILRDAQAILVYLASRYDSTGCWYPRDEPVTLGHMTMWLLFADELTAGAGAARLHDGMFYPCDIEQCRSRTHQLFRILDQHLWFSERSAGGWICDGEHPTVADIACFPYVMLSEEADISRRDYPAVRRWGDRIRQLPGFVPMAGIFAMPAT
jgi:glutathione S-transferase